MMAGMNSPGNKAQSTGDLSGDFAAAEIKTQ